MAPKIERFTMDFETYYDKEYSLKKMTPIEYVLDPRFESIMLSVKRPGKPCFYLAGNQIESFFRILDPDTTVMITWNALFDQLIAAVHYRFVPGLMIDAMGMARAWVGHKLKSLSLASVSAHLGTGIKGHEVQNVIGMRAQDIRNAGRWNAYADYCMLDSNLTEKNFDVMMGQGFPVSELAVLDLVLRMTVEPQFQLNTGELAQHLQDIQQDKQVQLSKAMMVSGLTDVDQLMSNPKFALILESLGVDPPQKISPTTGRTTWAFSKSDQAFTDLEEHPDPAVQAVMAARLGHKSTIEETRTERFLAIAQLQWPAAYADWRGRSPGSNFAPMPLRYSAAHTHRLGGDWKLNVQNFPARGKINHLKRALMAPVDHLVANIDSSQIEARIVAWLAQEWELLDQFRKGLDPYKIFAAKVFGVDVGMVTPEQRFLGKTSILGLGFGLGWAKFKSQVRIKSLEAVKLSGQGRELILEDSESIRIVSTYRSTYTGVPRLWKALQNAIPILAGAFGVFTIGPCVFEAGRISLPNGLYLYYDGLHQTAEGEWIYYHAGKPKRLYGGALLENIVQALARIIVMDAAVRIDRRIRRPYGVNLALQVHDALAAVIPTPIVTSVGNIMKEEMSRDVAWAGASLPLAADFKTGTTYGDCK